MKTSNTSRSLLAVIAALTLAACANTGSTPYPSNPNVASRGSAYSDYGVVQSIELVAQENSGIAGSGIGLGTVAGAVVGGVLGHQVGSGRGNTAATVAGTAGGAYVGHELEKRQQQKSDAYRITVRMDDGSYQTLTQDSNHGFRVGDRVRFENGTLQRY
jgi:outer membrane lipoprotein SlyB